MSMKDGIGLRRDACQELISSWLTGGNGSQLCFSGGRGSGRFGCVSQSVFIWRSSSSSGVSLDCDLPIAATGREGHSLRTRFFV